MGPYEFDQITRALGWDDELRRIFDVEERTVRRWRSGGDPPRVAVAGFLRAFRPALADDAPAARYRYVGGIVRDERFAGLLERHRALRPRGDAWGEGGRQPRGYGAREN